METDKIASMGLDDEVARCEAALPSLRDGARLHMLVRLAWQLRARQRARALVLCAEAEALLAHIALPEHERLSISARLLSIRGEQAHASLSSLPETRLQAAISEHLASLWNTEWIHLGGKAVPERRARQAPPTTGTENYDGELARFLASASHDLRQPLHALSLYLGALSNVSLPEPAETLLTRVRSCAGIVDGMFLSLLDWSRLDTQALRPQVAPFAVASLLTRIAPEFSSQAKAKGLELRVAPCSAWVQCDPALVEQILRQFVANAIRFTVSGKILIGCRRNGGRLRLAVYDTGIGISAQRREALFDGLNRADSKRRDGSEGLGLGMAIVQRLARLLSTPIVLASIPGRGSMFALDLQMATGHAPAPGDALSGISMGRLHAKLIVVVDDDDAIREATRILLEQWGCVVVAASSGAEALLKLGMSPCPPDALVCDYRLGMDESGLEVIRSLRSEFNHDIPALLVTGESTPAAIPDVVAEGLQVLYKPVHANLLREALIQILV